METTAKGWKYLIENALDHNDVKGQRWKLTYCTHNQPAKAKCQCLAFIVSNKLAVRIESLLLLASNWPTTLRRIHASSTYNSRLRSTCHS